MKYGEIVEALMASKYMKEEEVSLAENTFTYSSGLLHIVVCVSRVRME